MTTKNDIEKVLWSACDSFRNKIDSSRYKDYILAMLFVKYLNDVYNETKAKYIDEYNGDERRVERAMRNERFALTETSAFDYLYDNRTDNEIGQKINVALAEIENNNSEKLRNVFRAIDFNSTVDFGETKDKNAILRNLLEDFHELDLRPSQLDSADIIGDAYEYMISNFASDAGKKGGEFFTPSEVSRLIAELVDPKENERIYDPTCGSGGLLLKAYNKVTSHKVAVYGQEVNNQTWALCKMNMFLHGVDDAVMVQLITDYIGFLADQRCDDAAHRHIRSAEDHGVLTAVKCRKFMLKITVRFESSGNKADCSGSYAEFTSSLFLRFNHVIAERKSKIGVGIHADKFLISVSSKKITRTFLTGGFFNSDNNFFLALQTSFCFQLLKVRCKNCFKFFHCFSSPMSDFIF